MLFVVAARPPAIWMDGAASLRYAAALACFTPLLLLHGLHHGRQLLWMDAAYTALACFTIQWFLQCEAWLTPEGLLLLLHGLRGHQPRGWMDGCLYRYTALACFTHALRLTRKSPGIVMAMSGFEACSEMKLKV